MDNVFFVSDKLLYGFPFELETRFWVDFFEISVQV